VLHIAERHGWQPVGGKGWSFCWWKDETLISLICPPGKFTQPPQNVQTRLLERAKAEVHTIKALPEFFNKSDPFNAHMKTVRLGHLLTEIIQ
jgi:hypothetical protein